MKVKLANGVELIGTSSEVAETLNKLGESAPPGFYNSKSKGLIAYEDMHDIHLRNAFLQLYRTWVVELQDLSPRQFMAAVGRGPKNGDVVNLLMEMHRRGFTTRNSW